MAVIINGKVFVSGLYVGSVEESKIILTEGSIVDVEYRKKPVYIIREA